MQIKPYEGPLNGSTSATILLFPAGFINLELPEETIAGIVAGRADAVSLRDRIVDELEWQGVPEQPLHCLVAEHEGKAVVVTLDV